MTNIYSSGEYFEKNPGWHQDHSQWKSVLVKRMLQKHCIFPNRIAEIGCGAGGILEDLFLTVHPQPFCLGYEISPQAYALATKRQVNGLEFRLGSPPPDIQSFDVVLAMDVLEHVENYLGFIRELKPLGTWKIFHIPLDLSIISMYRPSYLEQARVGVGHIHYFTRETALASLVQAGLVVKDWFYTSVDLEIGGHGQKRLKLLRKFLFQRNPDLCSRLLGDLSILVLAE